MDISWFELITYLAVVAGAISGALVGMEMGFDLIGTLFLASITGLGGGIIRDVLLGTTPPVALTEYKYLMICLISSIGFFFLKKRLRNINSFIIIFDALGLGPWIIVGMRKANLFELSNVVILSMGVITAIFGGILRDILVNRIPFVFQREVYILPCLCGGFLFLLFKDILPDFVLDTLIFIVVASFRIIAYYRKWQFSILREY